MVPDEDLFKEAWLAGPLEAVLGSGLHLPGNARGSARIVCERQKEAPECPEASAEASHVLAVEQIRCTRILA